MPQKDKSHLMFRTKYGYDINIDTGEIVESENPPQTWEDDPTLTPSEKNAIKRQHFHLNRRSCQWGAYQRAIEDVKRNRFNNRGNRRELTEWQKHQIRQADPDTKRFDDLQRAKKQLAKLNDEVLKKKRQLEEQQALDLAERKIAELRKILKGF